MDNASGDRTRPSEYAVVIVGGGPAGCSAGVFTARYGLDAIVFDRGPSSLRRCAFLENYLGFPAGIDIETFYGLMHAQVAETGCELVTDTVESVSRDGDETGFVVETRGGQTVRPSGVIAATRHGARYLQPLDSEEMFEQTEIHGEKRKRFDPDYADSDGRTAIDGLYIATPSSDRSDQAIIAAGNGAHVARCLIQDLRSRRGYPEFVAPHYDWLRRDTEFSGEWGDRDRWREWFDGQRPDDPEVDDDRLDALREAYIDQMFQTTLTDQQRERRTRRGYDQLLKHVPEDRIREYINRKERQSKSD